MLADAGMIGKMNSFPGRTDEEKRITSAYDEAKKVIVKERDEQVNAEVDKIEQEYRNQRVKQSTIAMNLSRISPVSCYSYIVSEISATGVQEIENIAANSR
jgi:hypothetical protein